MHDHITYIAKENNNGGYARAEELLLGHYLSLDRLPVQSEDITQFLGLVELTGTDEERLQTLEAARDERDELLGEGRWTFFEKFPFGFDAETGEPLVPTSGQRQSTPLLELRTALLPEEAV